MMLFGSMRALMFFIMFMTAGSVTFFIEFLFLKADTVFSGKHAAKLNGAFDDLIHGLEGPVIMFLIVDVGQDGGWRFPSPAWPRTTISTLYFFASSLHLLDKAGIFPLGTVTSSANTCFGLSEDGSETGPTGQPVLVGLVGILCDPDFPGAIFLGDLGNLLRLLLDGLRDAVAPRRAGMHRHPSGGPWASSLRSC